MKDTKAMRWKMMGGNSTWLRAPTRHNMDKIYNFLVKQSEGKKRQPTFTYSQIAKHIGIQRHQVSFACKMLAFREINPLVKIYTSTTNKTNKLIECVVLIGRLK